MTVRLTAEQVGGLAPDAASLKAGQALAGERRWIDPGCSERALWGRCQGSGKRAYETVVDLAGPAFRCSCPSRKFPCKHALGLCLLATTAPAAVPEGEQPEWVTEWLTARDARASRPAPAQRQAPPDPAAQAQRVATRAQRVEQGLAEFERWLHDLARQGLAQAQGRPYGYWDEPAARLVDAQAPALASRVRALGGIAARGGERWAEDLLEQAGLLQLLLTAYRRIDSLPAPLQADVRALIGWPASTEGSQAGEHVRDRWAVLGRSVEGEERLRVQRVWLHGSGSGRAALVLSFAPAGQPLDASLIVGTCVDASLAFYPSAAPLRALVADQHGTPASLDELPGDSISAALEHRAAVLERQPWLWRLPACLARVVPVLDASRWLAAEPDGRALALACGASNGRRLTALAGGRPLALFGEWRGERLRPLSAFAEGRLVTL